MLLFLFDVAVQQVVKFVPVKQMEFDVKKFDAVERKVFLIEMPMLYEHVYPFC